MAHSMMRALRVMPGRVKANRPNRIAQMPRRRISHQFFAIRFSIAGSFQQKAGFRAASNSRGHRSRHLVVDHDFVKKSAARFDATSSTA
jgi:hypothetical protein